MKIQTDKAPEQQSSPFPGITKESGTGGMATIADNRPSTVYQRKLRETMNASVVNTSNPIQRRKNNTGLPDNLKTGIENLSGYAMDDVKVHYNSGKPAQLQAHAYAQGTDIHLAPGQEKHLPHEAWHVVQQKQGRVKPTMQLKGKVNVNDDAGLEKEADVMGAKAIHLSTEVSAKPVQLKTGSSVNSSPVQRYRTKKEGLTVAGELHSKSDTHRDVEEQFAKHIKANDPESEDDFLWKEDKKPGVQSKEVEKLRDDWLPKEEREYMASENPEHLTLSNIDRIKHYYPILIEELTKATASPEEGKVEPKDSIGAATIIACANAVITAIGKMERNIEEAEIGLDFESEEYKLISEWNRGEKINLDYIVQEIKQYGYFSTDDKDGILKNENFLDDLETINTFVSGKIDVPGGRGISHNFIRSRAMHELANEKKDVQGIWLIGQYHVQEIQEYLRHDVEYDLVSMFEFNNDIREFVQSEQEPLKIALSADSGEKYPENEALTVPGLNDRTGEISVAARLIRSSLKYFIDLKHKNPGDRFRGKREEEIRSDIRFHVNRLRESTLILMNIQESDLQNIDFNSKFPGRSENINEEIKQKITHIKNRIGLVAFISHLHNYLKGTEEALKSPPDLLTYLSYEDVYHAASELERLTSIAK